MSRTNDRIPVELEQALRRAARGKDRAEDRYRALIGQALEAGYSQAAIARAVGVSRGAINKARTRI